ncbi:MarR family transcriptional regulator [Leptospira sp. 2 VSF19]|uniref:MarR family transcriptional regulator n=1 Tax=Leptospira soteropolitanensis TaxID=2950025 RepID=A0AAW5VNB6_9LEPT|nr:MarR family transcriptional regulator [Leptospira soteropolitanensis]MCW7493547.1 MarR family transcriptional regulator [Leptospira soteropolitanensis]MCW7500922.1 MarR family transcriptional regulator [Leptospira soteropolitanensis]MCW7523398.1 MarR family transcriptional regulator [Leptospira soteropolitanensis]MCW7527259.1 MarR family transcriptional regulator [Leptospira soteropolitanensis]MCW7531116.1 MarR family transcriptional regulator [Leptospira soteropolitanensis]
MNEPFDLENSYAYLIYRTVRALRRQFMRLASANGLDLYPEQWFVLVRLMKQPGCSQSDLGRDFDDRPSMARALRNMEEKGWIKIQSNPEDGRKNQVYPTKKGSEIYQLMVAVVTEERKRMFKKLSSQDFKTFKRIIDQIYEESID